MLHPKGSLPESVAEHFRGGEGAVRLIDLAAGNKPANVRVCNEMVLEKGCSIGYHTHEGDSEIIYILSGSGICNDNGLDVCVGAGDTLIAYDGDAHSLRNEGDVPLRYLAVIVKA